MKIIKPIITAIKPPPIKVASATERCSTMYWNKAKNKAKGTTARACSMKRVLK